MFWSRDGRRTARCRTTHGPARAAVRQTPFSSQENLLGSRSTRFGFSPSHPIDPLPQEGGDPLTTKRVLIFLFALFVVATIVDVKVQEPYGRMAPWHRALDDSLTIPLVALISLGPATLCGFILWRFFFRNQPLTLGRVAVLFAVGSAMSCSWQGHGPGPVMFFIIGDIISLLFVYRVGFHYSDAGHRWFCRRPLCVAELSPTEAAINSVLRARDNSVRPAADPPSPVRLRCPRRSQP
jgi:hypothetical protein